MYLPMYGAEHHDEHDLQCSCFAQLTHLTTITPETGTALQNAKVQICKTDMQTPAQFAVPAARSLIALLLLQREAASTWQFMMGWMSVFNTRQLARWQLEVATGNKCIVCRTVEEMESRPDCWVAKGRRHLLSRHAEHQHHTAQRMTGQRRPRRRDKIYSALWHLVPPVPSL